MFYYYHNGVLIYIQNIQNSMAEHKRNIPSIGTPLTNHEISGVGTPSTSQLNCADSSSAVFTSSGGWPSFQYGGAGKQNKKWYSNNKQTNT